MRAILYTRPGCHLCEQAEELLIELAHGRPLQLVRRNILDDPALYARFKHAIPVIELENGPILAAPIDPLALRAALAALPA